MSNHDLYIIILPAESAPNPYPLKIGATLTKKGYYVVRVATIQEVLVQARQTHPAIAILDHSTTHSGYVDLCHTLRNENIDLPILVIKAAGTETEPNLPINVTVLTQPLTARKLLNNITRLHPQSEGDVLRVGEMTLYKQRRCLVHRGVEHRLTPMKTRLMEVFMRHPHKVLSRRFLLKEVWRTDYVGDTRTIEVHIRWLRQIIEDDPSHPCYLTTVRGVGYRFSPPGLPEPQSE